MAIQTPVKETPTTTDWGPFSLAGRHAVVTGGAMGIGYGIVSRFVEAGAKVLIADVSPAATAAAEKLAPGMATSAYVDVTDEKACEAAIQRCVEEFGSIDILVNNAGIYPMCPVLDMTPEFFERVLSINLRGLVFMCKAAALQMVKQGGGGKIVNIASIDSLHPSSPGLAAYDASKGGVLMFTKNFALEMAPHGVGVNAIAPGGIATDGTSKSMEGLTAEQQAGFMAEFEKLIPLGRMGVPDDIAKAAVFLASPASDYMTGSLVTVDGGRLLR